MAHRPTRVTCGSLVAVIGRSGRISPAQRIAHFVVPNAAAESATANLDEFKIPARIWNPQFKVDLGVDRWICVSGHAAEFWQTRYCLRWRGRRDERSGRYRLSYRYGCVRPVKAVREAGTLVGNSGRYRYDTKHANYSRRCRRDDSTQNARFVFCTHCRLPVCSKLATQLPPNFEPSRAWRNSLGSETHCASAIRNVA